MKYFLSAILLATVVSLSYSQGKLLTVPQMRQDLDYGYGKLNENHINPYLYISKAALRERYLSVRKNITRPLDTVQFYVLASGLVTARLFIIAILAAILASLAPPAAWARAIKIRAPSASFAIMRDRA